MMSASTKCVIVHGQLTHVKSSSVAHQLVVLLDFLGDDRCGQRGLLEVEIGRVEFVLPECNLLIRVSVVA